MAMVRKQIYIEQRQDEKLKRLAGQLGVTEAEVIRRAIEGLETVTSAGGQLTIREVAAERYGASELRQRWRGLDHQAWLEELALIEELAAKQAGTTVKFKREDAYRGRRFGVPD